MFLMTARQYQTTWTMHRAWGALWHFRRHLCFKICHVTIMCGRRGGDRLKVYLTFCRLDPCHLPASSSVIRSIGIGCARQWPAQQPPPRVACSPLLRPLGIHLHAPSPPPPSPRGISVRAPSPFPTAGTGRRVSSPHPPPLCGLTPWTYPAVENHYQAVNEVCTDVEAAFNGDRDDDEVEGGDLGAASDMEEDSMSEQARRSITGAQMWKRGPCFLSCVDWGLCWVGDRLCDLLYHTSSDASVSRSKGGTLPRQFLRGSTRLEYFDDSNWPSRSCNARSAARNPKQRFTRHARKSISKALLRVEESIIREVPGSLLRPFCESLETLASFPTLPWQNRERF